MPNYRFRIRFYIQITHTDHREVVCCFLDFTGPDELSITNQLLETYSKDDNVKVLMIEEITKTYVIEGL